jgi:DNA-binding Lrp family transcriptional regulator
MKLEIPEKFTSDEPEEKLFYIMVPCKLLQTEKIRPGEALVASLIYSLQQNKENICYASNSYISKKLGLHETSVTKAIARLKSKKVLEIVGFNGRKRFMKITTNIFRLPCIGDSPTNKKDDNKSKSKDLDGCKKPQPSEVLCGDNYKGAIVWKIVNGIEKQRWPLLYIRKRRLTFKQKKVIDHWCSKGKPFATPQKMKSVIKSLQTIFRKQSFPQVIQVIDLAFSFITNEDFRFMKKSFSFTVFLDNLYPIDEDKTYRNEVKKFKQALPKRHKLSWYNLFRLKDEAWLIKHLYRELSTSQKDQYYHFIIKHIRTGLLSYKTDLKVVRGARKMKQYAELNNVGFATMKDDFETFLGVKYPDITKLKPYYLASDNFWNEQYSEWIVEFGRDKPKPIEKVERI